ncbi:hypothetical protein IAQ61_002069 [Plenodomus lingam]|uniref:uncharacterized protein n=1 Tax=Leptosphaeria maculans TaxID=5022 RepID=UPI00332B1E94|nr:hypothetical protein IAQ61_002069 [Plenodomus lingam]
MPGTRQNAKKESSNFAPKAQHTSHPHHPATPTPLTPGKSQKTIPHNPRKSSFKNSPSWVAEATTKTANGSNAVLSPLQSHLTRSKPHSSSSSSNNNDNDNSNNAGYPPVQ